MLILSRKVGERIVIGGEIVITITEVQGDKTKVGIEAPKHIQVDRLEVWASKQQGKKVA